MSLDIFALVFVIFVSVLWYVNRGGENRKINRIKNVVTKRRRSPKTKIRSISSNDQAPLRLIPEVDSDVNHSNDLLDFTLLPFDILNKNQQQKINDMRDCCRQPNPLLQSLTTSELEAKELIDLIKSDAEMTAKIINTVNSSLFSLQQPIESIHHAIVFMGVTAVRSIAIQFILQQSLSFKNDAQAAAYQKIWLSSYIASSMVFLLAKHLDKENAAELSTLCLLMSLGDMTMLSYQPSIAESYLTQNSLFERVRDGQLLLDLNSSVIGKVLAEQWQLPKSIVDGIGNSLTPLVSDKLSNVLPLEEAQNALLCYLSCRLGDLIAFNGVKDIFHVENGSIEALSGVDFFYVQSNIDQLGLEKVSQLFQDPSFVSKARLLIAHIAV